MNKRSLITLFAAVLAAFGATTTHARTGGPDAFGYSFIDSLEPAGPTYNFEDISGGSALALADEEMSGAVPIGFTFNYYGTPYTNAYISSNGFISFLSGQNCCTADFEGEPIPMAGDPDAIIAAWWIDLDPFAGGSVYTQTTGTAPNRVFIVSFTDVPYFNSPAVVKFQFKLFEGSNTIEVHYEKVEDRGIFGQAGATAGIEDQAGTVGLQYTNDEDLTTPVAVRYSLPAPPDCGLEVTKSCFIEPPPAADFACSKPIDEITMIWDGVAEPVRIKAYKGSTSAALLLDTGAISASNPGVMIGDEVSVNGYAGSPKNVTWEIFDAFDNLLGRSKFHLSCSDDDMDGAEDCGKREGDGKNKKRSGGLINDWLLEGMVDTVGTLNCTPDAPNPGPGGTPATECEFTGAGSADVLYTYTLKNNSQLDVLVESVDDKLGPIPAATNGLIILGAGLTEVFTVNALVDVTTTNTLTSTATNDFGVCTREASATVTIPPNYPPDCTAAGPSVDRLWPPNHKYVPIDILGVTDPDGDQVTITIDSIFQDEPLNTYGDGNTRTDGKGVGTATALVRAERSGTKKVPGDGRVYHIRFSADDGRDACSGEVTVGVPHDQGRKGRTIIDGGALYDSTL